jgi:hypothetical protein
VNRAGVGGGVSRVADYSNSRIKPPRGVRQGPRGGRCRAWRRSGLHHCGLIHTAKRPVRPRRRRSRWQVGFGDVVAGWRSDTWSGIPCPRDQVVFRAGSARSTGLGPVWPPFLTRRCVTALAQSCAPRAGAARRCTTTATVRAFGNVSSSRLLVTRRGVGSRIQAG